MKHALTLALVCSALVVLFVSCGSSNEIDYFYQPSAHVVPDTIYSNSGHKMDIGLKILTPDKVCWQNDFVGFGRDSDSVAHIPYMYVTASIKRPSNATNCVDGFDTLRNRLVINFDKAGSWRVDFPQVDNKGNLIVKHYYYTVN